MLHFSKHHPSATFLGNKNAQQGENKVLQMQIGTYCGVSLGKGLPKATTGRKGVITSESTVGGKYLFKQFATCFMRKCYKYAR